MGRCMGTSYLLALPGVALNAGMTAAMMKGLFSLSPDTAEIFGDWASVGLLASPARSKRKLYPGVSGKSSQPWNSVYDFRRSCRTEGF